MLILNYLDYSLCHSIPEIFMYVFLSTRENILREGVFMEDAEHERCKLLWIIMIEKQASCIIRMHRRITILYKIRHFITVSTYTRQAKGESLNKYKTISFKVTWQTEDITHIVILCFLTEWYLPYEVNTSLNWKTLPVVFLSFIPSWWRR